MQLFRIIFLLLVLTLLIYLIYLIAAPDPVNSSTLVQMFLARLSAGLAAIRDASGDSLGSAGTAIASFLLAIWWVLPVALLFIGTTYGLRHGLPVYLAHRDLVAIEDEFSERLALWCTMDRGNSTNRSDRMDDFDRTANKTVDVYRTIQFGMGTEGKTSVQFRDMHSPGPIFKEEALTVMKLTEDERKALDAMQIIVRNNAAYMRLLLGGHVNALRARIFRDLVESKKAKHNPPLEVVSLLADLVGAPSTVSQLEDFKGSKPRYTSQVIWLAVRFWNHPSGGRIRFDNKTGMEAIDFLRLPDFSLKAPRL